MSLKIFFSITVALTLLLSYLAGTFIIHYFFESFLIGLFLSLSFTMYKTNNSHKEYKALAESAITNFKKLCASKDSVLSTITKDYEYSVAGQRYYFTDCGTKLHSSTNCQALYGKKPGELKEIILSTTSKKIISNGKKICEKCDMVPPQSFGTTIYYMQNGQKMYMTQELISFQNQQGIFNNQISVKEYEFILDKYEEMIIN